MNFGVTVQFPDNCFGCFDEWELEKIPLEEAATDWERGIGFEDIMEKESRLLEGKGKSPLLRGYREKEYCWIKTDYYLPGRGL